MDSCSAHTHTLSSLATVLDQVVEMLSHDNSSDHGPKNPAPKSSTILSSSPLPIGSHAATPVAAAASSILGEFHRSCKGFARAGFWRSID
ncbi:hypothetical protein Hdeb2414_s0018g00532681 [Helianthus debilis subsp. tardiflorus]